MHKNTLTAVAIASAALVTSTALLTVAGPLSPPAGPVTSTYKTLTEVEPRTAISLANTPGDANSTFRITQRGSYYLTGNVVGAAGRHGIEIDAPNVTLDLNGFSLTGVAGSLAGVFAGNSATALNITVKNGTISGWSARGVELAMGEGCTVERVTASNNSGDGIAPGFYARVHACIARLNGGGFVLGGRSVVTDSIAQMNTGPGFQALNGATISGSTAVDNTGIGFEVDIVGSLTLCTADSNGIGFEVNGILIDRCVARSNASFGIGAFAGSVVRGSLAFFNVTDGILVGSDCTIIDNTADSNGNGGVGAGIHVTGNDNRIERNTCTDADVGIDGDIAGNFYASNTCSGNGADYTIVAGQTIGPAVPAGLIPAGTTYYANFQY